MSKKKPTVQLVTIPMKPIPMALRRVGFFRHLPPVIYAIKEQQA